MVRPARHTDRERHNVLHSQGYAPGRRRGRNAVRRYARSARTGSGSVKRSDDCRRIWTRTAALLQRSRTAAAAALDGKSRPTPRQIEDDWSHCVQRNRSACPTEARRRRRPVSPRDISRLQSSMRWPKPTAANNCRVWIDPGALGSSMAARSRAGAIVLSYCMPCDRRHRSRRRARWSWSTKTGTSSAFDARLRPTIIRQRAASDAALPPDTGASSISTSRLASADAIRRHHPARSYVIDPRERTNRSRFLAIQGPRLQASYR